MITEFKAFLFKHNVTSLAVAFILGAAVGKVVTALVNDMVMPIVGMMVPGGEWRQVTFTMGTGKFLVGDLIGTVVDFVIIAFIVFVIGKMTQQPTPPVPPTKTCPACLETVAVGAKRCKFCTEALSA